MGGGSFLRRHQPGGCPTLQEPCSEPRSAFSSGRRSFSSGRRSFSLNGQLESQLLRLNVSEQEEEALASTQRADQKRSFSLQPSPTDLLQVLEEDFSVQSMTSIITEDCFYDSNQESPPMLKLAH